MSDTVISMTPQQILEEHGDAAHARIGPAMGIASIALSMAIKYHNINTVQDGALYQQYKLEGRNLQTLNLSMVFETAMRIEEHLIAANKRVTTLLVEGIIAMAEAEDEESESASAQPDSTA